MGLLRSDMTLASRFLRSPWAAETVWKKVEARKPICAKVQGPIEIPLEKGSKNVLVSALEEADLLSSKRIGTEHLLLGLLREEKSFAAEILSGLGVDLAQTRSELLRTPHDDSKQQEYVRERVPLPEEIVELQTRVSSIRDRLEGAIAEHDFEKAQTISREEGLQRDKLFQLYLQHGRLDWIYD